MYMKLLRVQSILIFKSNKSLIILSSFRALEDTMVGIADKSIKILKKTNSN